MAKRGGWLTQEVGGLPVWGMLGAVGFILVLGLVVLLGSPTPHSEANGSRYTPPASEDSQRPTPQVVLSRMDDTSRPFTVSVVGDSTGAISGNWARGYAQWLSITYSRPVEFHQWSVETEPNGYLPVETIGSGDAAPIYFWNGSAAGKAIGYTLENWGQLLPYDTNTTDLAFINHGHNVAPGQLVVEGPRLAVDLLQAMPNAALVIIGQNPQTDAGPRGDAQAENVRAWLAWATGQGIPAVDVLAVFEQFGDFSPLLDETGVHPTPEGSQLWLEAVISAFS